MHYIPGGDTVGLKGICLYGMYCYVRGSSKVEVTDFLVYEVTKLALRSIPQTVKMFMQSPEEKQREALATRGWRCLHSQRGAEPPPNFFADAIGEVDDILQELKLVSFRDQVLQMCLVNHRADLEKAQRTDPQEQEAVFEKESAFSLSMEQVLTRFPAFYLDQEGKVAKIGLVQVKRFLDQLQQLRERFGQGLNNSQNISQAKEKIEELLSRISCLESAPVSDPSEKEREALSEKKTLLFFLRGYLAELKSSSINEEGSLLNTAERDSYPHLLELSLLQQAFESELAEVFSSLNMDTKTKEKMCRDISTSKIIMDKTIEKIKETSLKDLLQFFLKGMFLNLILHCLSIVLLRKITSFIGFKGVRQIHQPLLKSSKNLLVGYFKNLLVGYFIAGLYPLIVSRFVMPLLEKMFDSGEEDPR